MLLVDAFQILLLVLFVFKECIRIFFPDFCLLFIDLLFIDLFLMLLLHLSRQVLSHLFLLLLGYTFSPFFFLLLFSQLVFDVLHHFLIFCSDLLLLVLND